MTQQLQQPAPFRMFLGRAPAPAFAETDAADDDVALGCECANPQLQIDEWRDEFTRVALNA